MVAYLNNPKHGFQKIMAYNPKDPPFILKTLEYKKRTSFEEKLKHKFDINIRYLLNESLYKNIKDKSLEYEIRIFQVSKN